MKYNGVEILACGYFSVMYGTKERAGTHLEGEVLQFLHQIIPSVRQLLSVGLNLGSHLGAPQQCRRILSRIRQLVQSPSLLLHVFL